MLECIILQDGGSSQAIPLYKSGSYLSWSVYRLMKSGGFSSLIQRLTLLAYWVHKVNCYALLL